MNNVNLRVLFNFLIILWGASSVKAQTCNCCYVPAMQPTGLQVTQVTGNSVSASFNPPAGADGYLVVRSKKAAISYCPDNLHNYLSGEQFGTGEVAGNFSSNSFTATGLDNNTTYYFFVYAYKNCPIGRRYKATNPLTGFATTTSACSVPSNQPANLAFNAVSSSSISGSFAGSGAHEYLTVVSINSTLTSSPVNSVVYSMGDSLGGGKVIARGSDTTFTTSGLNAGTAYYFFVFALNNLNCSGGPVYRSALPLTALQSTSLPVCTAPSSQGTELVFNTVTYNSIQGSFTTMAGSSHLVLVSSNASLSVFPSDGNNYTPGVSIGNATVVSSGNISSFTATGLDPNQAYYFYVFAFNNTNCLNGPKYRITSPLTGNQQTVSPPVSALNFYFGNLHAHSSHSDGNADDVTKTPYDDFQFAKTALCFDFLGISEHNHAEAGMAMSNWQPGLSQANAATTSGFVAMYGMEWGTISTGGHVVVYGVDSLIGWEANNYQIYVAKGDYTGANGLFNIINRNGKAFGYLAHPETTDYNNLISNTYSSSTDNAIIGCSVENGPAFSTATTYDNFPSPMSYLSYFRNMLAKGYKVGPTIDHDNHNMTFGKTVTSRLVILAPTLTRQNLVTSMKQGRFYASQDCAARITYSISTKPMGSVITQSAAPVISVNCVTSSSVTSLKVMYGTPGSGSLATQLTSTTGGILSYTDNGLTAGNTRYYYLDITESDGKRIITSPIWVTRQ